MRPPICIYTRPNDIRRGTNLWLILTDKKMETILLSNFDQIDGNYTLENYMEKGGGGGGGLCWTSRMQIFLNLAWLPLVR